jgi:hypothetical protein
VDAPARVMAGLPSYRRADIRQGAVVLTLAKDVTT